MADTTNHTPHGAARDKGATRKLYSAPVLRIYGDIALITKSVGMKGTTSDGGGAPGMSKTS